MRVAGLFLCHVESDRIAAHFRRLVAESGSLVEWHYAYNPPGSATLRTGFGYAPSSSILLSRHAQMRRNGGFQDGLMDVAIIPCALALRADFVWALEYDADFAGNWAAFFEQFADNPADLLTSTVAAKAVSGDWHHWHAARAPQAVPEPLYHRAFHPVLRLSRRFIDRYRDMVADPAWQGHYEFTLPTAALAGGFTLEDIGGLGAHTPRPRHGRNYENEPQAQTLSPGTLVWRPSRPRYFHEAPEDFTRPGMLYHPIKPDVADWNQVPAGGRLL